MTKDISEPSQMFKDRLRAARELRGMSQGELAAKSGLPPTSIAHFESGSRKPSFDNLRKLAIALTVTTDYLIGQADSPEVSTSADPLYRHVSNLSEHDRGLAEAILKILAERDKKR